MDKDQRRKIAAETVKFIKDGHFPIPKYRATYDLGVDRLVRETRFYGPGSLDRKTLIEVKAQTTLQAAQELAATTGDVGVLNFASGKNPGGGFLRGTQAQEETLARSSALYASLSSYTARPYYMAHKEGKDPRYSDRMLFTSEVPVFRDDAGNLLEKPYYVHVLTAAAPNRRALVESGEDFDDVELQRIIRARVRKILHIFDSYHIRTLVLGAWGCGVFGNSPQSVSEPFALALEPASDYEPAGHFAGRFDRVRFAIPSAADPNHQVFRRWFDLDDGKDSVTW